MNGRYALQNAMRYARLDIFSFHSNSICSPVGRTRYDINPRSRSEHIERYGAISNAQAYIENPRERIYIDALRLRAQSAFNPQCRQPTLGSFFIKV